MRKTTQQKRHKQNKKDFDLSALKLTIELLYEIDEKSHLLRYPIRTRQISKSLDESYKKRMKRRIK